MSSHHIVREKQEPALLVLGMEHFTDELLGQLLEWSPTVIATLHTAEKLNAAGINVDVIIAPLGGTDSDLQSDVKFIPLVNSNPVSTALNYLIEHQYPAVNVVTDIFEVSDYEALAHAINLVIYCANKKIYVVNSGFSKWKTAGEVIGILNPLNNISVSGLEETADGNYLTKTDGFFTLNFEQPSLFIAENIL